MTRNANKMERCKACFNQDSEKSNENWSVCNITKGVDIDVLKSGSSEKCKNFKHKKS